MALATPVTASSTNEVNAQCATLKASHLKAQYQVNNAKGPTLADDTTQSYLKG